MARLFDQLAPVYDQGGVPFFEPIATRLLERLAPQPGERAADVGCGRGAVTLPLCRAVGAAGHVVGVDLSASMVERLGEDAARRGVTNLDLLVGDAADVGLEPATFDLVSASLVLFFSPDPAATLSQWISLLKPAGRIGITTFGDRDGLWRDVDDLFTPYLPPALLDPRTSGADSPFASTAALHELFRRCGAEAVESHEHRVEVAFTDGAAWRAWTMTSASARCGPPCRRPSGSPCSRRRCPARGSPRRGRSDPARPGRALHRGVPLSTAPASGHRRSRREAPPPAPGDRDAARVRRRARPAEAERALPECC